LKINAVRENPQVDDFQQFNWNFAITSFGPLSFQHILLAHTTYRRGAVSTMLTKEDLGSAEFRKDHHITYAYVTGAMYRGTSSKELVIAIGKAGLLGYFGTGGLRLDRIAADLAAIQAELSHGEAYGMNLLCNIYQPEEEMAQVKLYLDKGVSRIEASAFARMTKAIVLFRVKGLHKNSDGSIECPHHVMAKISRPEVAEIFMSPPPESIVKELLAAGLISNEEASLSQSIPMSYDICLEADSGGHTDQGVAIVLFPAIEVLRNQMMDKYRYTKRIRLGLAGGIGTPESAAAAFIMGADFILTGSINQCTVESGAHPVVKLMLQEMNVQDTDYAPAGDMFELGAKVQVLRKGVFFPARANMLYTLYTQYESLSEIPESKRNQLEKKYFKKTFDEVWTETAAYFKSINLQSEVDKANANPKHKMALVFRWYFAYTIRSAFTGDESSRVDFQIHTGPALGAFNQKVKGTPLENWQNRHVADLADYIMNGTVELLNKRIDNWSHLLCPK
jgi:trans-AT polyketide synthase/acyltransferase/oxidoreductase domain-containing protein